MLYEELFNYYGHQYWWPLASETSDNSFEILYNKDNFYRIKTDDERFEIAVGAILTQNSSWTNALKALINLKTQKLLNPVAIMETDDESLGKIIKSSGYYRQKAKKLKHFSQFLMNNPVITRENVLSVWGIGNETADDIMLYAYEKMHFVIDKYTERIAIRLGLFEKKEKKNEKTTYIELQSLFENGIDKDIIIYKEFHALLDHHAGQYCLKKPKCEECFLNNKCKKII